MVGCPNYVIELSRDKFEYLQEMFEGFANAGVSCPDCHAVMEDREDDYRCPVCGETRESDEGIYTIALSPTAKLLEILEENDGEIPPEIFEGLDTTSNEGEE